MASADGGGLAPLAAALGVPGFRDGDAAALQRLVNTAALELLLCCQAPAPAPGPPPTHPNGCW